MSQGIRFTIPKASVGGMSDFAYVGEDEIAVEQLMAMVWDDLSTEVYVAVGEVSMFVAAWQDPDHWGEDWAEKLGIDRDDVPEAVTALLNAAMEPRP